MNISKRLENIMVNESRKYNLLILENERILEEGKIEDIFLNLKSKIKNIGEANNLLKSTISKYSNILENPKEAIEQVKYYIKYRISWDNIVSNFLLTLMVVSVMVLIFGNIHVTKIGEKLDREEIEQLLNMKKDELKNTPDYIVDLLRSKAAGKTDIRDIFKNKEEKQQAEKNRKQ